MSLKIKNFYMITLWLVVILIGTAITIIGGVRFNEEWTKNDIKKQVHLIPDFLLVDFEVKLKLNDNIALQLLNEIKPKYHVHGETFESQKNISLIGFFDDILFEEHKQAEKNYKLSENIYEQIRNFDLMATSFSKDSSVFVNLNKNTNKIIFTTKNRNIKDSYIEVKEYNTLTKELDISYHNIQTNVENKKLSRFITDLDKGKLNLFLIMKGEIKELTNVKIKTKSIEYFEAKDIIKDDLSYTAKLSLLLK